MFATGNRAKINPAVFEDQSVKVNQYLFWEALKQDSTGIVVEMDSTRSAPQEFWYRVKFHFFTPLLKEDYILPATRD